MNYIKLNVEEAEKWSWERPFSPQEIFVNKNHIQSFKPWTWCYYEDDAEIPASSRTMFGRFTTPAGHGTRVDIEGMLFSVGNVAYFTDRVSSEADFLVLIDK